MNSIQEAYLLAKINKQSCEDNVRIGEKERYKAACKKALKDLLAAEDALIRFGLSNIPKEIVEIIEYIRDREYIDDKLVEYSLSLNDDSAGPADSVDSADSVDAVDASESVHDRPHDETARKIKDAQERYKAAKARHDAADKASRDCQRRYISEAGIVNSNGAVPEFLVGIEAQNVYKRVRDSYMAMSRSVEDEYWDAFYDFTDSEYALIDAGLSAIPPEIIEILKYAMVSISSVRRDLIEYAYAI